jgi:hypothetical protein
VGILLAITHYSLAVYWYPEHSPRILFPFTMAWLLVVLYRMATSLPWVEERLAANQVPAPHPAARSVPSASEQLR